MDLFIGKLDRYHVQRRFESLLYITSICLSLHSLDYRVSPNAVEVSQTNANCLWAPRNKIRKAKRKDMALTNFEMKIIEVDGILGLLGHPFKNSVNNSRQVEKFSDSILHPRDPRIMRSWKNTKVQRDRLTSPPMPSVVQLPCLM